MAWSREKRSPSRTSLRASRKLLLPEPFGPTRNVNGRRATSQEAMLLKFLSLTLVMKQAGMAVTCPGRLSRWSAQSIAPGRLQPNTTTRSRTVRRSLRSLAVRLRQRLEQLVGNLRSDAANSELDPGERLDRRDRVRSAAHEHAAPEAHRGLAVLVPNGGQAAVLAGNERLQHLAPRHAAGGPEARQPFVLECLRPISELPEQRALAFRRKLDRGDEVVDALGRHGRRRVRAATLLILRLDPRRLDPLRHDDALAADLVLRHGHEVNGYDAGGDVLQVADQAHKLGWRVVQHPHKTEGARVKALLHGGTEVVAECGVLKTGRGERGDVGHATLGKLRSQRPVLQTDHRAPAQERRVGEKLRDHGTPGL